MGASGFDAELVGGGLGEDAGGAVERRGIRVRVRVGEGDLGGRGEEAGEGGGFGVGGEGAAVVEGCGSGPGSAVDEVVVGWGEVGGGERE